MRWLWRWFHMITLRRRQRAIGYLRIDAGDRQTGVVLAALPIPLRVQCLDSGGHPAANVIIQWDFGADGTVDATSTTDSLGYASATASLGNLAGTQSITARVQGNSLSVSFTMTATLAAADTISAASAISQSTTVSTPVSVAPSVLVVDSSGNPFAGQTVVWAVTAGGGSIDTTGATVTDANGHATLASWTAGASVGLNTVTATASGLTGSPVTFTCNGTAILPTAISIVSGNNQTNVVAGTYGADFTVLVTGAGAVPVPGATVSWATLTGGGLITVTSQTNASGIATGIPLAGATSPRDNAGVNTYDAEIAFANGSLGAVTFTLNAIAGPASQIALATEPGPNCASGSPLPGQPVVVLRDVNGNTATSASGTATATITAGDGSLTGDTVSIVAGVGTFTALTITDANGGTDLLHFSNGTFGVDAAVATSVAPPVPTQIIVTVQPVAVPTGVAVLGFAAIIADSGGTKVPGATGALAAALTTPGGATLSGTTTVNAVNGTATWSGLAVDTAGTYTLTLTDPAGVLTSAVTASFAVATQSITHSDEPVGMTLITENDFPNNYVAGTGAQGLIGAGWYSVSSGNVTRVTDQTGLTRTSASAYRIRYPVGFGGVNGGIGPCNYGIVFPAAKNGDTLYADFDWQIDPLWDGNRSGVNKMWFIVAGASRAIAYFSAQGAFQNPIQLQVRLQACVPNKGGNANDGSQNVSYTSASSAATIVRGQAFRVQAIFTMNSVDGSGNANADGGLFVRFYPDATSSANSIIYNKSTMAYRGNEAAVLTPVRGAGPTDQWSESRINPTWGGGGPAPTQQQYFWHGYHYLSSK